MADDIRGYWGLGLPAIHAYVAVEALVIETQNLFEPLCRWVELGLVPSYPFRSKSVSQSHLQIKSEPSLRSLKGPRSDQSQPASPCLEGGQMQRHNCRYPVNACWHVLFQMQSIIRIKINATSYRDALN